MKANNLIICATLSFSIISCADLATENQKIDQLQHHSVRKGDTKDQVVSKVGKPVMTNTTGSEETWTYMRDNQAGRQAAAAPFLMIPVVGIVVAGNELDKRGGIQSATLIVVFNSAGRVKSVNMSKTAVNHINN